MYDKKVAHLKIKMKTMTWWTNTPQRKTKFLNVNVIYYKSKRKKKKKQETLVKTSADTTGRETFAHAE